MGFILLAAFLAAAPGDTIVVTAGGPITLGAALEQAPRGGTILLRPGRYELREAQLVSRPVRIVGEGRPVLQGSGPHGLLHITADSVTLRGLVFRNVERSFIEDRAAVLLDSVAGCVVEDSRFERTFFGLYLKGVRGCRLAGNRLDGQRGGGAAGGNGIHLWSSAGVTVEDNEVTGHRDGIYLEFSTGALVRRNRSTRNARYGLHFMFSHDCEYSDNRFLDNGAGVAVMYSRRVAVRRNDFLENWGPAAYGLLLKEISDGTILRNEFHRNTTAIYAEGANRIVMEQNQFTLNGTALDIKGNCLDNHILENNFLANSFEVVTNTRHNRNKYDNNYWSEYNGYDLDRNGAGDEPHRPVNLFATITNEIPSAAIMMHSPVVGLMALAEQLFPQLIPETLVDKHPRMKPFDHD